MNDELCIYRAESLSSVESIIEFLDAAYRRYSGTVDRRQAHFPEVGKDASGGPYAYFGAQHAGRLVGVAGISAAGVVGDWVLERAPGSERAIRPLLAVCEKFAAAAGAQAVELLCATGDAPPEKVLIASGFRRVDAPATSIRILDFAAVLAALASAAPRSIAQQAPFVLHLHLERGDYPALRQSDLAIHVLPESVRIDIGEPSRPDAVAATTATVFTRFLFDVNDPAAREDAVTVTPPVNAPRAIAILEALRNRAPWFAPPSERR